MSIESSHFPLRSIFSLKRLSNNLTSCKSKLYTFKDVCNGIFIFSLYCPGYCAVETKGLRKSKIRKMQIFIFFIFEFLHANHLLALLIEVNYRAFRIQNF